MTDYISREDFIADKMWLYCTNCDKRKGKKRGKMVTLYEIGEAPCKSCGIHDMLEEVEAYPAADVRPVARGRWIEDWETGCSECSVCHDTFLWEDFKGVGDWDFCPNCGAEIRSTNCTKTATADEEREVLNVRAWLNCGAEMRQDEGNKEMSEVVTRDMAYAEYLND